MTRVMQAGRGWVRWTDNMDPESGLPSLADGSVSLVVTSPPYWNLKEYGGDGVGETGGYEEWKGYVAWLFGELLRVVEPGGKLAWNVCNMKVPGDPAKGLPARFVPLAFDSVSLAMSAGWVFYEEIIWSKKGEWGVVTGEGGGRPLFGSYPYPARIKVLSTGFEYVFVFEAPGEMRKRPQEVKERSRITQEQWKEWTKPFWHIQSGSVPGHPATFPIALPDRLIRMYSFVDDVVLDPFSGTGSTVQAAHGADRVGWGFEIAEKYIPLAEGRIHSLL